MVVECQRPRLGRDCAFCLIQQLRHAALLLVQWESHSLGRGNGDASETLACALSCTAGVLGGCVGSTVHTEFAFLLSLYGGCCSAFQTICYVIGFD
jgi:hypothetical protein